MPVITFLSDFGSLYPAQMKGEILRINPSAVLVDIAHDIPPQDIKAGAFALMVSAPHFPERTIHLAVVDPGVGSARRPIVIESGGHLFVGPDNGLLIPSARMLSCDLKIMEITNSRLFLNVSPTFHGRDIFAPVAAHLSQGMELSEVGNETAHFIELDFGTSAGFDGDKVRGDIVYVDGFGNLITNIPGDLILEKFDYGDVLTVSDAGIPLVPTYSGVDSGKLLMLVGSHGFLEIAVNSDSASRILGFERGEMIEISSGHS